MGGSLALAVEPCEHTFLTAQPHAHVRFRRAIERGTLWLAEDAARELPNLPLEDALQLVHFYSERGSPKYERAAMRWLERYLTEGTPRLQHFAEVVTAFAGRDAEAHESWPNHPKRSAACAVTALPQDAQTTAHSCSEALAERRSPPCLRLAHSAAQPRGDCCTSPPLSRHTPCVRITCARSRPYGPRCCCAARTLRRGPCLEALRPCPT